MAIINVYPYRMPVNSFLWGQLWFKRHAPGCECRVKLFINNDMDCSFQFRNSSRTGTYGVSVRLSMRSCFPGASIRVAHQRLAVLVQAAGGPSRTGFRGFRAAFGSGENLIQAKKNHQKHSDKGKSKEQSIPAWTQNRILHDDLRIFIGLWWQATGFSQATISLSAVRAFSITC